MASLTSGGKKLPLILEQSQILQWDNKAPKPLLLKPHYIQVSVQTHFETWQHNPSSAEDGRLLLCEALEVQDV